ncbi:SCO7613 C-terminal domain-containing membrane protein, partial [Streptomyces sp. NPDC127098]|uniref:SCO7613 C-terminal domain-containing membrane protein n=1 Tax=Streptomyces sp. NPDC127098 TaxID=3347137 RepID=UPI003662B4DF
PAEMVVMGSVYGPGAGGGRPPAQGAVAGGAALLCAGGLARALPAALGVPGTTAAFVLLAVALAAVPLAARLRPAPVSLGVECAGYAVAGWALVSAAASRGTLSAVLAGCAVGAAGVALRADRRPASYAAAGLLVLSVWVRLAAWEVTVPEAYTAPVALAFLGVGALRRLGAPGIPSWRAYGFGLGASLLPSLWALTDDPGWVRSLLLGGWALAVTLAGGRWRLRAPLLLGGGTLALVAGRELAPYVVQVAGVVPRWVPLALAGALLLTVGATYERRLRDARSLRTAWQRLG